MNEPTRYLVPDRFTRSVLNPLVRLLSRIGLSVYGSSELRIRGRSTGEWRAVPVNPMLVDGQRYLVAPRGSTQWVRNLRAAGSGELRVGRRIEVFDADEVPDEAKSSILREYLRRWRFEVKSLFPGLSAHPTDAELLDLARGVPVFAIRVRR
jgi:deazaflavin-dependent oxidoreductase (nitroreductase family)